MELIGIPDFSGIPFNNIEFTEDPFNITWNSLYEIPFNNIDISGIPFNITLN
jgi:hypothetical protein